MMKNNTFQDVLIQIQKEEQRLSLQSDSIKEAKEMIVFLQNSLHNVKEKVFTNGFKNEIDEINFFKNIKPQILGKLIYYNKIYKIEIGCPVSKGKLYTKYFSEEFQNLKQEYYAYICNTDFFRYYRSERIDRDLEYFTLGKINIYQGVSSYVFEIDEQFSTYYDFKVSKIIANELLYTYLLSKISKNDNNEILPLDKDYTHDLFWTDSKNSLIELIYALYITGCISHGKVGVRKMAMVFQVLFRVNLGDFHHAFHRMKERTGSQTSFIDQLKKSLEDYMNKDL